MKYKIIDKLISIMLVFNTFLFITSFSVACVILFRPFYYLHIRCLNLEDKTGYTYEEIKETYDAIIDYTALDKPLSEGKLKISKNFESHLRDCKKLFSINFILLGISGIILIINKILHKKTKLYNHSPSLWSSYLIVIIFILLILVASTIGFNNFFKLFHKILFFGKGNWMFNPDTDEIINILPQQYFMNCSILLSIIVNTIAMAIIIKETYLSNIKNK